MMWQMLVVAISLSLACAALSVVVVLRRWAFIGEAVAHAGFGGVGTAWLLSLAMPSLAGGGPTYAIAIAFCMATAMVIGRLTQHGIQSDTAIGIALVGSLAWGFAAQAIYRYTHRGEPPAQWEAYLLGDISFINGPFALAAGLGAAAVLLVLAILAKEIVSYCFDPEMARIGGLAAGAIHYLLIGLLVVSIVLTMRLMGQLLVTALLVLPGATGLRLSQRLGRVVLISMATGVVAAVCGCLAHARWPFLPVGPAVSLVLIAMFVVAHVVGNWRRA